MAEHTTTEKLLQRLQSHGLIRERHYERLRSVIAAGQLTDPEKLLTELLQRKLITRWQLAELNEGRTEFLLEGGRYLLLQKIGQGGMGAVYRARHVRMKRDVALKLIDPARAKDSALMDRFRREVEVCARLEHEHIVQSYDVGEHEGSLFLAMEYVEGSDLASLVRRDGPMSAGEVAAIGLQVAAALAYAHAQGIIHRDIKPSNTLLSTIGSCKILDMGLARIVEDATEATITELTQHGTVMGTVDYMSPEQARDSHSVDARSDIYSLGASLYFLLAGKPPFPGGKAIEKLHRLATEEPQALGQIRPDCPRELDLAIQQMMARSPEDRFQSAEDVVRALKPLAVDRLAGRPVVTTAVQTAAETHRETEYQAREETLPDFSAAETLYSSVRRRNSRSQKVLWISGAVAAALTVIVLGLISALGPERKPLADHDVGERLSLPAEPIAPLDVRVEFPGHFMTATVIEWSPDGQWLATGGADGQCRVWNPETGETIMIYRGHHSAVYGIRWSADGKAIASGEYAGEIHVWEPLSGNLLKDPIRTRDWFDPNALHDSSCLDLSKDRRYLACSLGHNSGIGCWDLENGRQIWSEAVSNSVVRFSPNGSRVLAVTNSEVIVWNAENGDRVLVMPGISTLVAIAWQSDDMVLIATRTELQTWTVPAGELNDSFDLSSTKVFGRAMRFSRSAHRLLILDESNQLVTVESSNGQPIRVTPRISNTLVGYAFTSRMDRFAQIDGHSRNIVVGSMSPQSGEPDRSIGQFQNVPECLAVNVLADRYLQASLYHRPGRGAVVTWDLQTGQIVRGFPEVSHVDEEGVIRGVVGDQVKQFELDSDGEIAWSVETLAVLTPSPEPTAGPFPAVQFSNDGQSVYSDNRYLPSTTFRLWSSASGQLVRSVDFRHEAWGERSDEDSVESPLYGSAGLGNPWLDVGPHLDGNADTLVVAYRFVAGRDALDAVRVWKAPWDMPAVEFPTRLQCIWDNSYTTLGAIYSAVSHDGRVMAATGGSRQQFVETTVLFDLETGDEIGRLDTGIGHGPITYHFSPNDDYLLTARQIWDLETKQRLWNCPEPEQAIGVFNFNFRGAALFSDDRHVVIAQDGQYQIWDWRANDGEGQKRATLYLMPEEGGYVFFNHETGHYKSDSAICRQYLRYSAEDNDGKTEWVTPYQYEQQTGWENDPSQAGLRIAGD